MDEPQRVPGRRAMRAHGPSDSAPLAALAQADARERDADLHWWVQALVLAEAVDEARRRGGDADARRVLDEASARSGLDANTLRRRVKAVEFLRDHSLDYMVGARLLPIGIAAKITNDRYATDNEKEALLKEFHDVLAADPGRKGVRAEVGRRLQALRPATSEDWKRHGDDWRFPSFDPRLGREGQPNRLPGQAALNLIDRFRPDGGQVVSACCGSGTVLDACDMLGVEDYVGFDLRLDPRVRDRHAARFVECDATNLDWGPVCARGTAGLIVVTAPPFTFGRSAEIDAATDLGRFVYPDEWLAAMEHVIVGATGALMVGGALAVTMRATAEFPNGSPVPDIRAEVGRMLAEAGYEFFLGNPVVVVGRSRIRQHEGAWLKPEVVQIVVMRKTSP